MTEAAKPQSKIENPNEVAEDLRHAVLEAIPPEERLRGIPPEERLRGVPPELRLEGLSAEEIMRHLQPEEVERLRRLINQEESGGE